MKRLIFLIDFNELVNSNENELSVDTIMEISFYSLLALINLTHNNLSCQILVNKLGGIQAILNQLKNPIYDPKKSACFCINNIVSGNIDNTKLLIDLGGLEVLVNLINDEEDD